MLQARGRNSDSGTVNCMTGRMTLTATREMYTLGYIYYIFFDPGRGLGLLLATRKREEDKLDGIAGI